MKKTIYLIAGVLLLFSCKKESSNPTTNTTTSTENTIKDVDGNIYKTVKIGTQTWMAENLKVTKYNDGTNIDLLLDSVAWSKTLKGAYTEYKGDITNALKYGYLYNYYTVSSQKICPTGWHVPTIKECESLSTFLGGDSLAGIKLIETGKTNWKESVVEVTNETEFTALPGGARFSNGKYDYLGYLGYWWNSDQLSIQHGGYLFGMSKNEKFVSSRHKTLVTNGSTGNSKTDDFDAYRNGFSIRCLKD